MEPKIRLATPADLAAAQAIVQQAYAPYIARIGRKPAPMNDDYARLISEEKLYVADCNGTVKGLLVLVSCDDALLLDNVAVSPTAKGTGIGRAMMVFAERMAVNRAYHSIKLYTNAAMDENISLYTRIGYIEIHRAEEMGLQRVYMRKLLAAP